MKINIWGVLAFLLTAFSLNAADFITTWKTDNIGTSSPTSITIPWTGGQFDVDWDNDGTYDETGLTSEVTHDFGVAGTYTIRIKCASPALFFNFNGDKLKLLSIDQWGDGVWQDMNSTFTGCANLHVNASDVPDLSQATSMAFMFNACSVMNEDISGWDTSNIKNMACMFKEASSFNQPLNSWNTSNVTTMIEMFEHAVSFNQPLDQWDTSNVTDMSLMFSNALSFNQPLNSWDTSNVSNMRWMFCKADSFNQPLDNWDTSLVSNMNAMFYGAVHFNQSLASWNISSVMNFSKFLTYASLSTENYDLLLESWGKQNLKHDLTFSANESFFTAGSAAEEARNKMINTFNWTIVDAGSTTVPYYKINIYLNKGGKISPNDLPLIRKGDTTDRIYVISDDGYEFVGWSGDINSNENPLKLENVSKDMTIYGEFLQNKKTYTVSGKVLGDLPEHIKMFIQNNIMKDSVDVNGDGTFSFSNISNGTYRIFPENSGAIFEPAIHFISIKNADVANLNFTGKNIANDLFITTWKTDNIGTSSPTSITIPWTGGQFDVDWDNDGTFDETGLTSEVTHDFGVAGTYTVLIKSTLPGITFEDDSDCKKLLFVNQWGSGKWQTMSEAFDGCSNFDILATDVPDLSECDSLSYAFSDCDIMNSPNLSNWDISNIEDLSGMFYDAYNFNQSLNNWDTSNVTNMSSMFDYAFTFNQPLNSWDTSNVTDMSSMFSWAVSFNQPLNTWNTSKVTDMSYMFWETSFFNQNIAAWDVSSLLNAVGFLYDVCLSVENYDALLESWGNQTLNDDVDFSANKCIYTKGSPAETARQKMIDYFNWNIDDAGATSVPYYRIIIYSQENGEIQGDAVQLVKEGGRVNKVKAAPQPGYRFKTWSGDYTGIENPLQISGISKDMNIYAEFVLITADYHVVSGTLSGDYQENTKIYLVGEGKRQTVPISSDGSYMFPKVQLGNYRVFPENNETVFEPVMHLVSVNDSDVPGIDFSSKNIPSNLFVTTWKTDNIGTSSPTSITIPWTGGQFDVDWDNDGTFDETGLTSEVTHNFGVPGIYTVSIKTTLPGITFEDDGDCKKLIFVNQWGSGKWQTMSEAFDGCSNFDISATDVPDLSECDSLFYAFSDCDIMNSPNLSNWDISNIEDLNGMFYDAYNFNQSLNNWDTSKVIYMESLFEDANMFNQPLDNWDTSSVTDMNSLFNAAYAFNQPLNSWDTSKVTDMSYMFSLAIKFNQPLDKWDTSNVTDMSSMFFADTYFNQPLNSWNTSNVTDMSSMFAWAVYFNQPLNAWDTSKVTDMKWMFDDAYSFDQDISNWNVSSLTDAGNFLDLVGLSPVNYDALLIAWSKQNLNDDVPFSAGNSKYTTGGEAEEARNKLINDFNWTITDGGPASTKVYRLAFHVAEDEDVSYYEGGDPVQFVEEGGNSETISVFPETGYRFTGWTGDYTGTNNTLTIRNVHSDMTIYANFEPINSFSISGTVTGDKVDGVTISIDATHSTVTDADGKYLLTSLFPGEYTVAPSLTGCSFTPENRTVTITDENIADMDFVSKLDGADSYALTVVDGSGSGNYTEGTIVDVSANDIAGKIFDKWSGDIANLADVNAADTTFTMPASDSSISAVYTDAPGTFSISGTVSGAVPGVRVSVDAGHYADTDASGNYTITGLLDGDYTVTPVLSGYAFTPASTDVAINGANETGVDFTASEVAKKYTLTVNNGSGGGEYAVGAIVNVSADAPPAGQQFDSWSGDIAGLADVNTSDTTFTMPEADAELTALYKVATPTTYSISGVVSGDVKEGVKVSVDAAHFAITDADGNYSIDNLENNTYTVTPAMDNYTFTPVSVNVIINDASKDQVDFSSKLNDNPLVAVDDDYTAIADRQFSAETSVLANDLYSGIVNIVIVKDVEHGTLDLKNTGLFDYTPDAGFIGEDSFTYKIVAEPFESENAVVTITVQPVNVTIGMQVKISPEQVDNLPGTSFAKPPKIYGTVNTGGKSKKVSMKKDKSSSPKLAVGIWSKKTPLYDKKAVKSGYNSYISSGRQKAQLVQLMIAGQTSSAKFKDLPACKVLLVPPEITEFTLKGTSFMISGNYFGSKAPKVMLEPTSGGKVFKLKVDKNTFRFSTSTGESSVRAYFKPGKIPPGKYYMVLDNKIGIGVSYDEETNDAFLPLVEIP